MGAKRASTRTLPSGERVRHYPDGTLVLIRDSSALVDRLADSRAEKVQRSQEIRERNAERVRVKRALQRANAHPPEKSPV